MWCFTWHGGKLAEGLAIRADERLGQVVFLGEEGRGRRYEKVALGRRNPAEVVNGHVLDAHPVKITLPPKDGKPEKVFYVLERPQVASESLLVQVSTQWCYTKNSVGRWQTIAGSPETIVSGFGAHGDAGRIGNWADGLVNMKPGDVIKVQPEGGYKISSYALWIGEDGKPQTATWKDYENLQAVAKAQVAIAEAEGKPEALNVVFGQMPAFTMSGGQITKGLTVTKGATGPVIAFGESGRGRLRLEIPLVGFEPTVRNDENGRTTETVEQASVVKLDEKVMPARYSWEQPKVKIIYGLTQSAKLESAFLVQVNTGHGYTRRGNGKWDAWKGSPQLIGRGYGADGDAGGIGSWDDGLFVLREGDVLYVRPSGDGPAYAIFVRGGQVCSQEWTGWKVADAKSDAAFYVAKRTAPWGHTPAEWIGSVVSVLGLGKRTMIGNVGTPAFVEEQTGELISVSPLVLNLGWDGRDRHDIQVCSGLWIRLETDKQVRRLEGAEAEKRKLIRAQAEALRSKAIAAAQQSHFGLTEADLRREVQEIAQEQGFDTMPTEGWYDSLTSWVEKAKGILTKFAEAEQELKTLEQRQSSGEVLVDFGGHFRVMGATGQAQFWVIRPDGAERDPDEVEYRKRYTSEGDKYWRLVGPGELAISWFKGCTAASHEFIVNKLPAAGCTGDQLAAVSRLEAEISPRFASAVGMSGTRSPGIGNGWNLGSAPTPTA